MPKTRHVSVGDGVLLLVGTMKGAFLVHADRSRKNWNVGGPYLAGEPIYAMAFDGRQGRRRLFAAGSNPVWGATLHTSDDFGRTWTNPENSPIRFPEGSGGALKQIWQVTLGRPGEDNVLYAGVEPAALFESRDAGTSWTLARALWDHPHRPRWEPGFGGLCLHTICPAPDDPGRILVAISSAGVYRTDDGGASWTTAHRGVRAEFRPDTYPEFGQCVHKIDGNAARPGRYFLQNHWGLYRTDDAGATWTDIADGVPSDFGFPVVCHPHDPDTAYIVPLESDNFRCTPEGKLRVYRTRNAGKSWQPFSKGLPQANAYETVLRDGMGVDALDPAGIYFGTRSGRLYASRDEGRSWKLLADGLPPIVCVKTAVIATTKPRKRATRRAQRRRRVHRA